MVLLGLKRQSTLIKRTETEPYWGCPKLRKGVQSRRGKDEGGTQLTLSGTTTGRGTGEENCAGGGGEGEGEREGAGEGNAEDTEDGEETEASQATETEKGRGEKEKEKCDNTTTAETEQEESFLEVTLVPTGDLGTAGIMEMEDDDEEEEENRPETQNSTKDRGKRNRGDTSLTQPLNNQKKKN